MFSHAIGSRRTEWSGIRISRRTARAIPASCSIGLGSRAPALASGLRRTRSRYGAKSTAASRSRICWQSVIAQGRNRKRRRSSPFNVAFAPPAATAVSITRPTPASPKCEQASTDRERVTRRGSERPARLEHKPHYPRIVKRQAPRQTASSRSLSWSTPERVRKVPCPSCRASPCFDFSGARLVAAARRHFGRFRCDGL
jgi:hypothetical protein